MPRKSGKKTKLALLSDQIAEAGRIIDAQQALLKKLRIAGAPTQEAEGAMRTYASSLSHLLAHERKLEEDAKAKKGETKLKGRHQKAKRGLAPPIMPAPSSRRRLCLTRVRVVSPTAAGWNFVIRSLRPTRH